MLSKIDEKNSWNFVYFQGTQKYHFDDFFTENSRFELHKKIRESLFTIKLSFHFNVFKIGFLKKLLGISWNFVNIQAAEKCQFDDFLQKIRASLKKFVKLCLHSSFHSILTIFSQKIKNLNFIKNAWNFFHFRVIFVNCHKLWLKTNDFSLS